MIKRISRIARDALRTQREILDCSQAALEHQKYISVNAVENFYSNLNLPPDKMPHCRFDTKKRLMDLYERDIVYLGTAEDGCLFRHLEHDTQLLIPFAGFNEFVLLCWDVYVGGYDVNIAKPFIVIDIGSNLYYAALAYARNPLCRRVFCYEIIPAIYQMGEANLELNPRLQRKITGANVGLFNRDGETQVTYYPLRAGASGITEKLSDVEWLAKTADNDFLAPENREQFSAQVRKAGPTVQANSDNHPDDELVIKIDAENAEYEILEDLLPSFDRVYCFVVEIHSEAASRNIMSLFKGKNYTMEGEGMVKTFYNKDRINSLN